MNNLTREQAFIAEWGELHQTVSSEIKETVGAVVAGIKAGLASHFYESLMQDEEAQHFLDSQLVHDRLHASLQAWLLDLLSENSDASTVYRKQFQIGAEHARIQIPFELIARGARIIRKGIIEALIHSSLDRAGLVSAVQYIEGLVDLALDAMASSYIVDTERIARSDEAYKLFAYGQNLMAEREKQRAALHEWAHQMLIRHINGQLQNAQDRLGMSDFGIWLEHKAAAIFEESPELGRISRYVMEIDELFPRLSGNLPSQQAPLDIIKEIDHRIDRIKFLLGEMFERFIQLESGRDSLTHLLNRRFLPSILAREVQICRHNDTQFALLLLDIDHFKAINDTWGHSAGDMVLQQTAEIVSANVRAGDFVFRYGGEEILVVLVELTADKAMQVAENIRRKFEKSPLNVGHSATCRVTVSIGVACYNGHPDFDRVIKAADAALYSAKETGRNRCVLEQPPIASPHPLQAS